MRSTKQCKGLWDSDGTVVGLFWDSTPRPTIADDHISLGHEGASNLMGELHG